MNYKEMMLKCIEIDILNISELKEFKDVIDIINHYKKLTDLQIIKIYDEYFGLESE